MHHPCSSKLYPVLQERKTYKLCFLHPLLDFSLESTMKKFIQELDGRRNLEATTLQRHLKAAAVAFKCQTDN